MIIGKADRRITIERATYTTNTYGERAATWATLTTVWAELMKVGGTAENIVAHQDIAVQTLRFKVRSSTTSRGIKADDRVSYKSKLYDVIGIEEVGRNAELVIVCKTTTT
jgi:SPP1 family predicted phage head-tail adaptor